MTLPEASLSEELELRFLSSFLIFQLRQERELGSGRKESWLVCTVVGALLPILEIRVGADAGALWVSFIFPLFPLLSVSGVTILWRALADCMEIPYLLMTCTIKNLASQVAKLFSVHIR